MTQERMFGEQKARTRKPEAIQSPDERHADGTEARAPALHRLQRQVGNRAVQQLINNRETGVKNTTNLVVQRFPPLLTEANSNSLEPGDIVITHAPEFSMDMHQLIKMGQFLTGKLSHKRWQYVHASIYAGAGNVIEAAGGNQMKVVERENIPAGYIAFRYQGDAADRAKSLAVAFARTKAWKNAKYSKGGALASILTPSYRGKRSKKKELKGGEGAILTNSFYCSNLVVRAYNQAWVMNAIDMGDIPLANAIIDDPPINVDADYISPGKLVRVLDNSHKWKGVEPVTRPRR